MQKILMALGFGIAVVFAIGGIAYRYGIESEQAIPMMVAKPCNLHQAPCKANTNLSGRAIGVELDINPKPIAPLKSMKINIYLSGITDGDIDMVFTGQDMDMGMYQGNMQAVTPSHWTGNATIPICTTAQMAWKVSMKMRSGRDKLRADFPLVIGNHP